MKCPHCSVHFHDNWDSQYVARQGTYLPNWSYSTARCPECERLIVTLDGPDFKRMVYPVGANRGPVPVQVPKDVSADYVEACNVLPVSSKASAALARRCLQTILSSHGYKGRDLSKQIDAALAETDASKALPASLRDTIDAIRNFGNFSAHPIDDQTTLQIVDVQPEEADWCLQILEEMFDHFYVRPAAAAARKAALNAKLAAAGKPPAK